ncbi:hypothetical protein TWF481_010304 [Arthrobotrys musiformis]|uniref:Uncharacterized protein n=1 Tax=Arthrobotrys musiformis TaxID=47236 RepID=A0AAV9W2D2_9PEZI
MKHYLVSKRTRIILGLGTGEALFLNHPAANLKKDKWFVFPGDAVNAGVSTEMRSRDNGGISCIQD